MTGILVGFVGGSYGAPPVNTVAPAVTGTATFGQTLSTTNGTWTAAPPITGYAYQWQRAGSNISGATSSTYVLVSADVGNTIRCVVTATNAISSVASNSNSTVSVAAVVPGIPTGVSATATSDSAISVSFSAPASNGGASIDYYQAVCTGSGTNSATGTSPISITGLNPSTSYTFQVRAHNSAGYGSYSSSTGTATTCVATGSSSYTSSGTYTFTVPSGVSSVSMVAIGSGALGQSPYTVTCPCYGQQYIANGSGGHGGALSYRNNYSVTSGTSRTVVVEARISSCDCGGRVTVYLPGSPCCRLLYAGTQNRFSSGSNYGGAVGRYGGCRGSQAQLAGAPKIGGAGGGGAAGYSGYGGYGGNGGSGSPGTGDTGGTYCGGGGGGGAGGSSALPTGGGGGGGTGIYGQGSSGSGGSNSGSGGGGGGGGSGGTSGNSASGYNGGNGGSYGGGGGGPSDYGTPSGRGLQGTGAVRIVWPGNTRTFPSTSVGSP